MKKTAIQGVLLGAAFAIAIKVWKARKATPETVDCSGVEETEGTINGIHYLEIVRGAADPETPMPMVIVFHSRGATAAGAATFPGIEGPVRIIRPTGFLPTKGGGTKWFTKSSKKGDEIIPEMEARAGELAAFIGTLMHCRPTTGLPIVTGSSEGGHVAYLMASRYYGLVGGAVALLGYIPQTFWNPKMAPTVGFHGIKDTSVPYQRTADFWAAMKAAGAPLVTRDFPVGHALTGMGDPWRVAVETMAKGQR